jgi:hypothetical protein
MSHFEQLIPVYEPIVGPQPPTALVVEPRLNNTPTFDHRHGKAYELKADLLRLRELEQTHSPETARQLLLEEMTADLLTHFSELNRVGAFSYYYRLHQGQLVEDSQAQKPIKDMFANQDGVIANLWLEHIIPTLENMPVGSSLFTYSARQDGAYEGGYDYAYIFQKIDSATIESTGIELVLTKSEQAAVINQLHLHTNTSLSLLTDHPDPDDIRSRAFWFPPDFYTAPTNAFSQIIGQVVKDMRPDWQLDSPNAFAGYLNTQKQAAQNHYFKAARLAASLLNDLDTVPLPILEKKLIRQQQHDLYNQYADTIQAALERGETQVLLPCGFVDIGIGLESGDLRFSAGTGLIETQESVMRCVTCPFCKKQVDAILTPTHIVCPKCHAQAERKSQ